MTRIQVELEDLNREKLDALARRTGRTRDQLVNEAVERLVVETDEEEHEKFLAWREALLGIEGMWADRDDLPDFGEIRRSMDRGLWER